MAIMTVFAAAITLFIGLLFVKKLTSWHFCVMCLSITAIWVGLLLLSLLNYFNDPVIIALLMGQSIVGIYYLAEKILPQRYMIYRVAGLLSLTYAAYASLAGVKLAPVLFLALLWVASSLLYVYRKTPRLKSAVEHILACCRDW